MAARLNIHIHVHCISTVTFAIIVTKDEIVGALITFQGCKILSEANTNCCAVVFYRSADIGRNQSCLF